MGCDGVTVGADARIRNPPLFIIENVIISSHIVYCSKGSDVDLRSGAINRIIGIPEDGQPQFPGNRKQFGRKALYFV